MSRPTKRREVRRSCRRRRYHYSNGNSDRTPLRQSNVMSTRQNNTDSNTRTNAFARRKTVLGTRSCREPQSLQGAVYNIRLKRKLVKGQGNSHREILQGGR